MLEPMQMSYAVRCSAVVAIGAALFACWTRTEVRVLSPADSGIVGTWTYSDNTGILHSVTFYSDHTCEFFGAPSKYPSRWRCDGKKLFFLHQYQTVIGSVTFRLPNAMRSLELPSFMAKKEEVIRSISFSADGSSMTFGAIDGGLPACTLTRAAVNAFNTIEDDSPRGTMRSRVHCQKRRMCFEPDGNIRVRIDQVARPR